MKKLLLSLALLGATYAVSAQKTLEAIGALAANAIYDTYTTIGLLADSYEGEVYEADFAITLLQEQQNMANSLAVTLQELIDSGEIESAEDRIFLRDCISIYQGLADQAAYCIEYIRTGYQDSADKFQTQRTTNWDRISLLLGLN